MRRNLGAVCAALGVAIGVVVQEVEGRVATITGHVEQERVRLRAHFDSVLLELKARDVSHLTSEQRAARLQLTAWLAEYRDVGEFPLNDLGTAAPVPIFRDSRGVLCAMAYLIDRSGRRDIVGAVASSRNTAYIAELIDDDRLVAWLDSVGVTALEAARIQPAYVGDRSSNVAPLVNAAVLTGSLFSFAASVASPRPANAVIGFLVGGVALASATADISTNNRKDELRSARAAAGSLAIAGALFALNRKPGADSAGTASLRWLSHLSIARSRDPGTGHGRFHLGLRRTF